MEGERVNIDDFLVRDFDPRSRCSPESEDATIEFEGFQTNVVKQIVYWLLVVCTLGFFWLLCLWVPKLYIAFNVDRCPLSRANRVCAKHLYKEITPILPERREFLLSNGSKKYFVWRFQVWRWYDDVVGLDYCSKFRPDSYPLDKPVSEICTTLLPDKQIYHQEQRELIKEIYGENLIRIPVRNPFQLFLDEVLHPFYLFQLFSVVLWYVEIYATYATAIIIISATGATISILQARRNMLNLKKLAEFECKVNIYNLERTTTVSSKQLVPGDIIEIREGLVMPCDVVLLQGQCVVNEAMLTGESVPVIKAPVVHDDYDVYNILAGKHAKYTLFGGTQVLQIKTTNAPIVLGKVVQTGFSTTKGGLVRSILYPKPLQMKFYRDSFYFIGFLFFLACAGWLIMIYRYHQIGTSPTEIIVRGLDLFTISIPPALPIALTIGVVFAVARLKKKKISCIAPSRVNIAGLVEIFCFDKTGTLTEDGLDVKGVRASSVTAHDLVNSAQDKSYFLEESDIPECKSAELMKVLTACHSLALLGESLIGDSLEVKMFEATNWILKEISHDDPLAKEGVRAIVIEREERRDRRTYGILKQYDFSSEYQRMSTLCVDLSTGELFVCTKGAPEVIGDICVSSSVPADYHQTLIHYTKCGFRVLGCSIRALQVPRATALQMSRQEIESDLHFTGLLIMQNKLKKETKGALKVLNKAEIGSIMITGDNPLTACYVAVGCHLVSRRKTIYLSEIIDGKGILWQNIEDSREPKKELLQLLAQNNEIGATFSQDQYGFDEDGDKMMSVERFSTKKVDKIELAVTGTAFEMLINNPEELELVLKHAHIFARMKPDQKQYLVELIAERGKTVGMCGDGANDCGALKAADVGISLSEAEASIAAPFTSAIPNIGCVNLLLQEGRAALVTSFQAFKYMASYSLIQYLTSMILYAIGAMLGDMQFLWIDLFIVMPLAFVSEYTAASDKLTKRRPITSLMSWNVITSLVFQNLINLGFLFIAFGLLYSHQEGGRNPQFFVPLEPKLSPDAKHSDVAEVSTLFLVANFQYLFSVVAFSVGKPFRKPFYTNFSYVIVLIILLGLNLLLLLWNPDWILKLFALYDLPIQFRLELLVVIIANAVFVLLAEELHHFVCVSKDVCGYQTRSTKAAQK